MRTLFVAYVAATLVHVGWILAHEPFSFDAWNVAVDTDGKPFSLAHFFDYWKLEYTHSNPRIGQALTYLAYKVDPFAQIASPLAYLAISFAITTFALGRWPWRRGRDLALWTFVIGAMWFALPELGKTLFCRAYGANYVYGAALQLLFVLPLRLTDGRARPAACAAYALAGVIAGACNEHTGPTLIAGFALYAYLRRANKPTLVWAGGAGALVGFAALFFAPGQAERYEGLAQKASLFGRLAQRGFTGNLDILRDLLLAAAPTLALIAIALVVTANTDEAARRRALRLIAIAIVAGIAMAVTIFVSPKLGTRFYLVSCALLLAGFVALADATFGKRGLAALVVLALVASTYAAVRTIPLYARAKRASDARIAALEAAPADRVFIADAFDQIDDSWWFLGDDFRDSRKRDLVAHYFALPGVVFRAYNEYAPLGVASARFVPHYTTEPPGCIDEHGGFSLGSFKGFDLPGIHREMKVAIELLRERLGAATQLRQLDLAVELDDPKIVFPRPRVLVGRWRPDHFEGYAGQLVRRTREFTRDVIVPPELRGTDREIFVYRVGDEAHRLGTAHDDPLRYAPWGAGIYWILACDPTECFVIAATRQSS